VHSSSLNQRGDTLLFALVCDTLCAGAREDAKERAGNSHGHKDREPNTDDRTAFIDLDLSATLFRCRRVDIWRVDRRTTVATVAIDREFRVRGTSCALDMGPTWGRSARTLQ